MRSLVAKGGKWQPGPGLEEPEPGENEMPLLSIDRSALPAVFLEVALVKAACMAVGEEQIRAARVAVGDLAVADASVRVN